MRRKDLGPDFGLAVRMALALVPIVLFYVVGAALSLLVLIGGIAERSADLLLGWLLGTLALGAGAAGHFARAETVALRAARATLLRPDDDPELHALVARVAAAAGLPPPKVALVRSWSPNAFAVGVTAERAVIALTTELLRRLDPRELEAVVAHEVAHIANRDSVVMTVVSGPTFLGTALRVRGDSRGWVFFHVFYWPVHVIGLLLMWTISRYREFAADRGSALVTGAPEQLMSALAKIGGREPRGDLRGGAAVSALCIVPAQRGKRRFQFLDRLELMMDHPPLEKRLDALAEMARDLGRPSARLGR
ncbi:MAG: M48 family metalloprotease [Actinomycetota bacterium]|nr:M48 family metalloprotease [Actinomycetota bacterium]